MRRNLISALLVVCLAVTSAFAADGGITKTLKLENGIEVVLISDPDLDRSAASMVVNVGSMDNPRDQMGIAHFLEHMLFLGTEKYPDSADYKDYLAQNDGMSNAYTANNITNYHFEVRNDAFEGALDRFAHFFIDPLMTDALSEREVNAVDSEQSKNLQDEFWRTRQVYRSLLNPEHPHCGFSTGNRDTLAGVKNETLRAFYESKYSSNIMHLVILSAHPMEQLESWVETLFADVPNRNREPLAIDVPLFGDGLRGKLVEVKSLQDVNQLWVRFELPKSAFDHDAKPTQILGGVLGHEGQESLLQSLKSAGLATSLSAGAQTIGEQGTFNLTLSLTPAGMTQLDAVLDHIFGSINQLRALPELPVHIIEQRQRMAELELRFRQRGPAMTEARTLAAWMVAYPYENLLPSVHLIPKPSQASIRAVLDVMTPENAMVLVYAKDRETDQVEEFYGTEFRVTPLGDERIAKLKAAKPADGVGVPAPNPFIPTEFDLVDPVHAETPWHAELDAGEVWLRHDTLFGQPKAALQVVFYNDKNSQSSRDFVLGNLYAAAVRLAMTPHSYPLNEAGVNLGVTSERRGITLSASGYSQKIPELAEFAIPFLTQLQIDAAQFAIIKESMQRGLANFGKQPPTSQAFELFRNLIREVHFTPAQQAEALAPLALADLADYFERVHAAIRVRAFAYGNMSEESVQRTVDLLVAGLAPKRIIPEDGRYRGRVIKLAQGSGTVVRQKIDANDSITMLLYEGTSADRESRAALTLLGKVFPPGFYGDLRTLQQTGYIVQSGAFEIESLPLLFALSQSSVVGTDSLRGRFVAHMAEFLDELDAMPDATFEANREAAIAGLAKKSTSFEDELTRNTRLAYAHFGDFADTDKQIAALGALTKERWIELTRAFLGSAARVSIQLDGASERRRFQEQDLDTLRKNAEGWQEQPKPDDV